MLNSYPTHFRLAACLWGACTAAAFSTLPASAQPVPAKPAAPAPAPPAAPAPPPTPPAAALTPAQGAAQALDQAHQAKNVTALNPYLTNESAAFLGFTLILGDSLISSMASALTPDGKSPQAATEKAFQNQVDALLNRYSLTEKSLDPSKKADSLPPALITQGHQFLSDASALSESYENSHSSKSKSIGSQMNGSDLPMSSQCVFKVLSQTHVQIVPRGNPKSPFGAYLEGGQWRIDMIGLMDDSAPSQSAPSKPKPKTMSVPAQPKRKTPTPQAIAFYKQAAAFFEAVDDEDSAMVGQKLKANPALANLRSPAAYEGDNGRPALFKAVFNDDIPVIMLLLKAGAKVNTEDGLGDTALGNAAFFDRKEVMTLLLDHGASLTHRNVDGETALYEAVEGDSYGTAELLLAHGADGNARDNKGITPLGVVLDPSHHGDEVPAIINLLRRYGGKK